MGEDVGYKKAGVSVLGRWINPALFDDIVHQFLDDTENESSSCSTKPFP